MNSPRILIAGSGAVGAVYAAHLEQAGCYVSFLVRDRNAANAQMPRDLHRFRMLGKPRSVTQDIPCIETIEGEWDQLWLCLPSTALETEWLGRRLQELDQQTPLLSWTPDIRDRQRLEARYRGPVSQGLIGLLSFQSPLPDTDMQEQGFAYLLPPMAAAVVDASPAGRQAADWLNKGGLATRTSEQLPWLAARGSAVMINSIAALELSGWSFRELRAGDNLTLAAQAAREAIRASALDLGTDPGMAEKLPYRSLLSMLLAAGPALSPVPLEAYMKFHFSKVGKQTRMMLDSWLILAEEHQVPAPALSELRRRLGSV